MASTVGPGCFQFGTFELDVRSGELRKAGVRIGLQEQSLQVLRLLLERPGDLVTRDELRQRLWPNGTFVDFDHGLNAVINRLRETLGDSADSPRFIQTVPRRGYRFIAPVDGARVDARTEDPASLAVLETALPGKRTTALLPWIAGATIITVSLLLVIAATWLLRRTPLSTAPPPRVVPLTRLAGTEAWPAFAPDGEQVAFAWSGENYDNTDIYVTLVGSTGVRRLTTDPADDYAPSWSPDGRRIAFLRRTGNAARIHVDVGAGWARLAGERISGGRNGADTRSLRCTSPGRPTGAMLPRVAIPRAVTDDSAGIF